MSKKSRRAIKRGRKNFRKHLDEVGHGNTGYASAARRHKTFLEGYKPKED